MFKKLWNYLFSPKPKFSDDELALIKRMIEDAQAIADGTYLTESKLPPPAIPERRKNPR